MLVHLDVYWLKGLCCMRKEYLPSQPSAELQRRSASVGAFCLAHPLLLTLSLCISLSRSLWHFRRQDRQPSPHPTPLKIFMSDFEHFFFLYIFKIHSCCGSCHSPGSPINVNQDRVWGEAGLQVLENKQNPFWNMTAREMCNLVTNKRGVQEYCISVLQATFLSCLWPT